MKDTLIDFGIPALLITGSFILIGFGIDGEVKTVLTLAAGWAFRSSYVRRTTIQKKGG
ncbi:unnamed protein product, partial [marine sediment metagenome]